MNTNIIDIITKKKNKEELTYDEINYAITNYLNGTVKDYQMSSLLMAIVLNGMTDEETFNLTKVMLESGDIIDLSNINGEVVDKHSTGGVGDKTTLILAPLLADSGLKVAKMSGRGLGHTGGTIDKLESINGFKVKLDENDFIKQVNDIGLSIISQTANLVPADKKLYALRDVTGTTESIPLIASSIMSKKIASGANHIILDVKVGNGALMKNVEEATALANEMIKIGKKYNKKVICVLTNMEEPLGNTIGNAIEVKEAIDTLQGKGPEDLKKLVITLSSLLIESVENRDVEEIKKELELKLKDGSAYEKFKKMVEYQGGNIENIEISDKCFSVKSSKSGWIKSINTLKLGEIARDLGAGRFNKDDKINYKVGLYINQKVGDFVLENEELVKVYYDDKNVSLADILSCFEFSEHATDKSNLIIDIIK